MARKYLSEALKMDPLNPYVCHSLASLELRYQNIDKARNILLPVYSNKPTSAICVLLAELEKQEGNFGRAKEILLYGLKHCIYDKSQILLSLAWLEEGSFDNFDEAYKLIELALEKDSNNVKIYIAKANMELRSNKFNLARNTLYEALKLPKAEDGKHYTMLGTLEIECGNYKEAQRVLLEGSKLFPGDFYLLQRLGSLEAKYGSASRARDIFSKAVIIEPHAPTFVSWAIMEEELGNLVSRYFSCFLSPNVSDGLT